MNQNETIRDLFGGPFCIDITEMLSDLWPLAGGGGGDSPHPSTPADFLPNLMKGRQFDNVYVA